LLKLGFFSPNQIFSVLAVLQVSELVGPVAENQETAGPTHALRCMHPREFILLLYTIQILYSKKIINVVFVLIA
jgi:hypothetical protein